MVDSPEEASATRQNVHLAWMMKLAVATAIIRRKPRHVSGEEYTKVLCNQFALSELNWRRKYESVETELIRAKQELLLKELHAHSESDSQSDMPCNFEPIFPTPPPSLEEKPRDPLSGQTSERELDLHSKFLQGVTHLKSVSNKLSSDRKQLNSVTKATICKSVCAIEEAISGSYTMAISCKCLLHATETIATVCKSLSETCWPDINETVAGLLDAIVKEILLNKDALEENGSQESLCEMFLNLAVIDRLQETGLDILLGHVEEFSAHLRRVARHIDQLDPVVFENIYFVLGLLETLVTKGKMTKNLLKESFYQRFVERLDDSLLHLTDHFPLFAQLVWRICCRFMSKSQMLQSSQASV